MASNELDLDRATLNALSVCLYRIDRQGLCTFVNDAALQTLGYVRDEVLGRDMHQLIHHTRADFTPFLAEDCPLLEAGRTGRAVRLADEILWRKDGSSFTAAYSAIPLHPAQPQAGVVVTFLDSSSISAAHSRLALQLNVSRILTNAMDVSAALTGVLGAVASALSADLALYRPVGGESRPFVWWSRRGFDASALVELARSGAGVTTLTREGLHRRPVAAGAESAWEQAAFAAHVRTSLVFPVIAGGDALGEVELLSREEGADDAELAGGVAGLGRQIGQFLLRRQTQDQLRSSEARRLRQGAEFRALADNIPQLAWMAEPDGDIYWYNRRWYEYTGETAEEMQGRGWAKVHHPDHLQAATDTYLAAIASGEAWEDTFPLRRHDGEYRWFLSRAQAVLDEDGEITRWVGTNTDITDQRDVEIELASAKTSAEEANAAKSRFLANMSHELRTPLNAVIGYSEMLREAADDLDVPDLLPDLEKIHRAGKTLLSLVNDVLDLAKIEAGRMDLFLEDADLAELADEVAATVQPLAQSNGNRLSVEVEPGVEQPMRTDATKLRQILLNLLANASKFTRDGRVTLGVARQGDVAVIEVRDTGIGMTSEQMSRLFQPFQQAEAATARDFGGTGLGLELSRRLAQAMGGDVTVESTPGEGSTFRVVLPWMVHDPVAETGVVGPIDGADDTAPLVLVIDDDPDTQEIMRRLLSKEGLRIASASTAETGVAAARDLRPAAITLDVMLPGSDGWRVLSQLKADPVTADIPVIMLSMIEDKSLGYALGASEYLTKPIDRERLHSVLSRHLRQPDGSVLIVEDDPSTRELLCRTLAGHGYAVRQAENGLAALESIAQATPSLVLLDLLMPEMDGFDFLHALREREATRETPVIVVTSKDLSPEERRRINGDVAGVMQKGALDREALLRQVASRLSATTKPARASAP